MSVKRRYWDEVAALDETWADARFVLASDYSTALAVLRQCVAAGNRIAYVERSNATGIQFRKQIHNALARWEKALAAARKLLEEEV
jgi:hypothetical protein